MKPQEIIEEIDRILQNIIDLDPKDYIHDPHKERLLDLCREAFLKGYFKEGSSPRLYADTIARILNDKWADLGPEHPKMKLFNRDLYPIWDEWAYVLEKINYQG